MVLLARLKHVKIVTSLLIYNISFTFSLAHSFTLSRNHFVSCVEGRRWSVGPCQNCQPFCALCYLPFTVDCLFAFFFFLRFVTFRRALLRTSAHRRESTLFQTHV